MARFRIHVSVHVYILGCCIRLLRYPSQIFKLSAEHLEGKTADRYHKSKGKAQKLA